MSIYMSFFVKFLLTKKSVLNSIVYVCVKKSKVINVLDVKLIKNSDITKLANLIR